MDLWNAVSKWFDHNRWLVVGFVVSVLLAGYTVGCDPTTRSLLSPEQRVTVTELEREVVVFQNNLDKRAADLLKLEANYNSDVDSFNSSIELAKADLAKQVELRMKLIETAGAIGTAAATGGITAPAAIAAIVQLLTLGIGAGAVVNGLRKDKVISKLKNGASKTP